MLGTGGRVAVPMFVPVGGALKHDNEGVFRQLLARTDTNKIVIVPFASADADAAAKSAIEEFKTLRPDARYVVLPDPTKGEKELELAAEWIAHADLVWFTGGDQSRLIPRFYSGDRPNAVLQSLHDGMLKYDTPVGGTSAGCACLSDPMFTGGGSEGALGGIETQETQEGDAGTKEGGSTEPAEAPASKRGVQIGRGLGLIPGVIMDSHFAQRGRIGRMVAALEKRRIHFGFGVNENRALIVHGGSFRGIGDAAALMVDTRDLKREGLSRLDTRVSLLGDADVCWINGSGSGPAVTFEMVGKPGEGFPAAADLAKGIPPDAKAWDKNVVIGLLQRLAAEPRTAHRAASDGFEVIVSADERTKFYWREGMPGSLSVAEAKLDIRERAKNAR
jgi:cyanophycinase